MVCFDGQTQKLIHAINILKKWSSSTIQSWFFPAYKTHKELGKRQVGCQLRTWVVRFDPAFDPASYFLLHPPHPTPPPPAPHYGDVIMDAIASQITSLTIVYSTVYSDADQRKHQSSASLTFVRGIHRGPMNSLHKMASNAENVSIWWRHHAYHCCALCKISKRFNDQNLCYERTRFIF